MSDKTPLKVVVCWHMHQPQYKDLITGRYHQPWTYLHAIKDYVDMAAHLEAEPAARAVVNFAPILLEQIDDYSRQINAYLHATGALTDPLLAALASPVLPADAQERVTLIKSCLRANRKRLIDPFPHYKQLADLAEFAVQHTSALDYMTDQFIVDLLVWYHLAWLGETVRRNNPGVKALLQKERDFSFADRRVLLTVMGELIGGVLNRYRELAQRGQIELSLTPYAHPIVPLLLDLASTREAMPEAPLPELDRYPGGEERARWHLHHGVEVFRRYFGFKPEGCWPSEGSVSEAALRLFADFGFKWVATGENVYRNSVQHASAVAADVAPAVASVHHAFAVRDAAPVCFFRDDGLSDLVGFTYADWHADDAVANLVHHLENIRQHNVDDLANTVVSIILDGENAWEYYPANGFYFLSALYRKLSRHPAIELTTFSAALHSGARVHPLPVLTAGSWVYGTFSTWIGERDKNRGWDILGDLKHAFDRALAEGRLGAAELDKSLLQMAVCEGSDWFWWFGDYNPEHAVSDFERLFRTHVANMYQLLGVSPPDYLAQAFSRGKGAPAAGGVMRTGSA